MSEVRGPGEGNADSRGVRCDEPAQGERLGLRAIAVFEALKGVAVLMAGSGLLLLMREDIQTHIEQWVAHLHLNPARKYPRVFIEAAGRLGDGFYIALAAGALAYAGVRFVEAYGLWKARNWAEWVAILSGGIFLPIEVWRFWRHGHPLTLGVLLINAWVVGVLLGIRWRRQRPRPDGSGGGALSQG